MELDDKQWIWIGVAWLVCLVVFPPVAIGILVVSGAFEVFKK